MLGRALSGAFGLILLCVTFASADSIAPASYTGTLAVGESVTIDKTLTVNAGGPTSARLDVMFLVDTTGSMGGVINQVKTSATTILSNLSGLGDVRFGVSEYRDITDAFSYREVTKLTANTSTVTSGINALVPSGGGDIPEANLFALESTANATPWRAGSTRVVVWFGDAPGHDPRMGSTETSATNALTGNGVTVHALDSSGFGNLDSTGQATRITSATGGGLFNVSSTAGVSTAIQNAVTSTFSSYSTVGLGVEGDTSCVDVTTSAPITGSFDRSTTRTFDMKATITGKAAGSCNFNITGLVDGGVVATESDMFTVTSGTIPPVKPPVKPPVVPPVVPPVPAIPLPAGIWLMMGVLGVFGGLHARRRA